MYSRLVDLYDALTDARIKQVKAVTMRDYLAAGREIGPLVDLRCEWRRRIIMERNALRQFARRNKDKADWQNHIAGRRYCEVKCGMPLTSLVMVARRFLK